MQSVRSLRCTARPQPTDVPSAYQATTFTFSAGNPAIDPSIKSPGTTGPTFSGVPLKMMSPGINSKAWDSWAICSATLQIIWFRSASCLTTPFTFKVIEPCVKWPTCATRWMGPMGAERSKLLPISQGFF